VVWKGYPLKKDYTWGPIENLYGHEELVQTYEQWTKTEIPHLTVRNQSQRKTTRQLKEHKVQDDTTEKFRKADELRKKTKGAKSTVKETLVRKWQMMRRKLHPTETKMVVL
jgi:hypothetical protein